MSAGPSSPPTARQAQFLALAGELRPELHRYCARLMGSVIEGEDVVQDTFTRAYVALDELQEVPPLRAWLFKIAHNRAVDLLRLAFVRSGDKGHLFNVAVIARKPEYLPWLRAALQPQAVGEWYRHLGRAGPPRVDRHEVPGFDALNLVVHDALEGGINASTQLDPAAKGMGQMLLRFPVMVPADLAVRLGASAA